MSSRYLPVGALLLAAACGGHAGAGEPSASPQFIAFASNFAGYHSWQSFDVTDDAVLVGIHDGSTVTEYLNRRPTPGSTEFPVGTIIVKEATGGTNPHELFAMTKRGGGYNSAPPAATGWEWYELQNLNDGHDDVQIVWSGLAPPVGSDVYSGAANGGCNTCHSACGNDGVCAKALDLSKI